MENEKLAQGVKELRKRKGLSQEELAKNSGLSLRTIQRVENGETAPTGETLKRISTVLEVAPNELIDWNTVKETFKKTVKTKYEYLHIFDSKLVITKSPKINNLVEDYTKSVNNIFKTLAVFIIAIPIFTILAVVFYNMGKWGLTIYAGAFAFLFLTMAFYSMLFTSGSSLIMMKSIYRIKIQKKSFGNVVVIFYKEFDRLKQRYLILEKNQVDSIKNILLSEKLIEEKDIELRGKNRSIYRFVFVFVAIFIIVPSFLNNQYNNREMMTYYGFINIFLSAIMITKILIKLIKPLFNKTKHF